MAAYAALVSLINITEQIHNHPRLSISLDKKQIESLCEKAGFLKDFTEVYSHIGVSKEAQVLESQIASVAYAAEDVIESHVVDQIHAGSISLLDLREVIEEMDFIKEKVMKFKEKMGSSDLQPTYSIQATSSRPMITTDKNSTMIGFDDELIQLMEMLIGQQSSRQIIPIVGMGGIGKTTLARNAYENLSIVQYFDIRAWVTVSQRYNVREILLELLNSCQSNKSNTDTETEDQLGEKLHKSLSGRRYLIILDDVWSIEAWEKIRYYCPDNINRSRIVVTTRVSNMALHFGSSRLSLNLLEEDKSWDLFHEKTFAQARCPPEFEEIGKVIAKKCKGLPLSITVIGGLLGKSSTTQEYWENVAKDINSILNSGEDEHCSNILSLSYRQLPAHLKPCFLYMGIFPEDHEIRVSRLIKLWVAEGFLKPNKAGSLEEVAEGYLKDLVDRNLVLVRRWGLSGKIKTCSIHDLLRDLCLRKAEKDKFLCVMNLYRIPRDIGMERRLVLDERVPLAKYPLGISHSLQSESAARSLICNGGSVSSKLRLLRVLNTTDAYEDSLEDTIFKQLVNLRYLAHKPYWILFSVLPSSVCLLWNVQTLIIKGGRFKRLVAPLEIWYMPQLRHVEFDEIGLPDPPSDFVLLNLQTLSNIVNSKLSEEVCKRIPELKKLHITYDGFSMPTQEFGLPDGLIFPSSLQKLILKGSRLHWEDLTMIGSLPNLEVLKLLEDSAIGTNWRPVEGEFIRLKFLKISRCFSLMIWDADSSHFPVLENLVLCELIYLKEIPLGIGEIPTLGLIRVEDCNEAVAVSAMGILEEQESLGNEGLRVQVDLWDDEELEMFKEKVKEMESITSRNLVLKPIYKTVKEKVNIFHFLVSKVQNNAYILLLLHIVEGI